MENKWESVYDTLKIHKAELFKSYKCLNKNRPVSEETINRHKTIILSNFEKIKEIINNLKDRLTPEHKVLAWNIFHSCRDRILKISAKHNLHIQVSLSTSSEVKIDIQSSEEEQGSENSEVSDNDQENSDENISNIVPTAYIANSDQPEITVTMPQTIVEFLSTAARLIPEFDGRPENLQSFVDALNLVESIKDTHETSAVSLIKTKLKGTARNLISSEATIQAVIAKLKGCVKGESVDVISAKIMNVKQQGKNANAYAKEIEDLTKSLEGAYISDGLPHVVATKYATQLAVRAITKNAQHEKVKLIIESGQFNNMNDLMSKFISSCTDSYGQPNSVLHYQNNYSGNNQFRGRGRGGNRYNQGQNNTGHYRNNNVRGQNRGQYRGQYRGQNRGNYANNNNNSNFNNSGYQRSGNNPRFNNGNVRMVTENQSENQEGPLNQQ